VQNTWIEQKLSWEKESFLSLKLRFFKNKDAIFWPRKSFEYPLNLRVEKIVSRKTNLLRSWILFWGKSEFRNSFVLEEWFMSKFNRKHHIKEYLMKIQFIYSINFLLKLNYLIVNLTASHWISKNTPAATTNLTIIGKKKTTKSLVGTAFFMIFLSASSPFNFSFSLGNFEINIFCSFIFPATSWYRISQILIPIDNPLILFSKHKIFFSFNLILSSYCEICEIGSKNLAFSMLNCISNWEAIDQICSNWVGSTFAVEIRAAWTKKWSFWKAS